MAGTIPLRKSNGQFNGSRSWGGGGRGRMRRSARRGGARSWPAIGGASRGKRMDRVAGKVAYGSIDGFSPSKNGSKGNRIKAAQKNRSSDLFLGGDQRSTGYAQDKRALTGGRLSGATKINAAKSDRRRRNNTTPFQARVSDYNSLR